MAGTGVPGFGGLIKSLLAINTNQLWSIVIDFEKIKAIYKFGQDISLADVLSLFQAFRRISKPGIRELTADELKFK